MPAGQYNFTVEQGATFLRSFYWQNQDQSPVSITGYAAKLQVRLEASTAAPIITLSTGSEGGVTLIEPNIIQIKMLPAQTTAMKFDKAVYDLKLTAPNGDVTRLIEGRVTLSLAVTR